MFSTSIGLSIYNTIAVLLPIIPKADTNILPFGLEVTSSTFSCFIHENYISCRSYRFSSYADITYDPTSFRSFKMPPLTIKFKIFMNFKNFNFWTLVCLYCLYLVAISSHIRDLIYFLYVCM